MLVNLKTQTCTLHVVIHDVRFTTCVVCQICPSDGALQVRPKRICCIPIQHEWLTLTIGPLPCFKRLHQSIRPEESTVVSSSLHRSVQVFHKPVRHNNWLELEGVDPFMSVVTDPLVARRPANRYIFACKLEYFCLQLGLQICIFAPTMMWQKTKTALIINTK